MTKPAPAETFDSDRFAELIAADNKAIGEGGFPAAQKALEDYKSQHAAAIAAWRLEREAARDAAKPSWWFDNLISVVAVGIASVVLLTLAFGIYQMMTDPEAPDSAFHQILQMGLIVGFGGACFYGIYRMGRWLAENWRRPPN
jgi:hypothetical protein